MENSLYRQVFKENLRALLEAWETNSRKLKAVYLSGPKRGKTISPRSLRYYLEAPDSAPSPSLDAVAAIANAFDLEVWQLLVPALDPRRPPVIPMTPSERSTYELAMKVVTLLANGNWIGPEEADDGPGDDGNPHSESANQRTRGMPTKQRHGAGETGGAKGPIGRSPSPSIRRTKTRKA